MAHHYSSPSTFTTSKPVSSPGATVSSHASNAIDLSAHAHTMIWPLESSPRRRRRLRRRVRDISISAIAVLLAFTATAKASPDSVAQSAGPVAQDVTFPAFATAPFIDLQVPPIQNQSLEQGIEDAASVKKDKESHPDDLCDPLPQGLTLQEACDHVTKYCHSEGKINYLQLYYCDTIPSSSEDEGRHGWLSTGAAARRAFSLLGIVLWIMFLFSCLGLVASDFFCPNLGTLASRLGMNESTAGVTFLALGNGSPDVFSTFTAMSTDSGALAIGELIGAASFIVSIVAGSMMLIKPFKVRPYPFMRDVGFFTVAVSMTTIYLIDAKLTLGECLFLVGLYLAYASTVIVGSLWEERKRKQRLQWEQSRGDYLAVSDADAAGANALGDDFDTAPAPSIGTRISSERRGSDLTLPFGLQSQAQPLDADLDADPFRVWSNQQGRAPSSPSTSHRGDGLLSPSGGRERSLITQGAADLEADPISALPGTEGTLYAPPRLVRTRSRFRAGPSSGNMPRHSLLGAIEFRDVVTSLRGSSGQTVPSRPSLRSRRSSSPARSMESPIDIDARTREAALSHDPERFLLHPHRHPHGQHGHRRNFTVSGLEAQQGPLSAVNPSDPRPFGTRSSTAQPKDSGALSRSLIMSKSVSSDGADGPARDAVVVRNIEDPWRSHGPDDGCDETTQTASSSNGETSGRQGKPALPKLDTGLASKAAGRDEATVPAIQVSNPDGSRGSASHDATLVEHSVSTSTEVEDENWHSVLRSLRRTLFPSLRHWKTKSMLGRGFSILNAPPLLLLNLTLPVVDDEAEARAAAALDDAHDEAWLQNAYVDEETGRIKLDGPEGTLYAASVHDPSTEETVLDLSTGQRVRLAGDHLSPMPSSPGMQSATGELNPWQAESQARTKSNRRRDLEVANALRRLPTDANNPLIYGETSPARKKSHHESDLPAAQNHEAEDDAVSCTSDESGHSHTSAASHSTPKGKTRIVIHVTQCLLALPFCAWVATDFTWAYFLGSTGSGVLLAGAVLALEIRAQHLAGSASTSSLQPIGLLRCFLGFIVSVAWISLIVNEVVAILQAIGVICGLSDAILGLTVFAAGNSLADLVADVTIARAGYPIMAISACFAGPLLNLLLGIGLSGSYILSSASSSKSSSASSLSSLSTDSVIFDFSSISTSTHTPTKYKGSYPLSLSPTLISSVLGLLAILVGTLIAAPLNRFEFGRKMGLSLIAAYVAVMTINLVVEIVGVERHH